MIFLKELLGLSMQYAIIMMMQYLNHFNFIEDIAKRI